MPIEFDPQQALAKADQIAEEQENFARSMLWDRITEKAANDQKFRKQLVDAPEKTVEMEAQRLGKVEGRKIELGSSVVEKVTARVRDTYSSIVPDLATDKVEKLIFGTIEDVQQAYKITLLLSQVLFYTGLAMVIAGFVSGLVVEHKMLSLLFGGGGIASMLISSLIVSPLDRVQTAAGNLVQLQMAYLSYYKQLYLLGGNNSALSKDDAIAYAREIDRLTLSLMGSVQEYVEQGSQPAKNGRLLQGARRNKPPVQAEENSHPSEPGSSDAPERSTARLKK